MAVTTAELSIALRLTADGTGLSSAQTAILARLVGVADAHTALLIPTAPVAIMDECVIRMAGYLYEAPVGRRDSYANAWVNSGAGSLASRWQKQAASGTSDETPGAAGGAGLTVSEVQSLIDQHRAVIAAHHDPSTATGVDSTARMSAQEAQAAADVAQATAAANATELEAHESNALAHHVPPLGGGGGVSLDERLPASPVAMRMGWAETQVKSEAYFTRADDHPVDGASSGMSDSLNAPPFPPALATEADLYLWVWLEGNPTVGEFISNPGPDPVSFDGLFQSEGALTVGGVAGTAYVSTFRFYPQGGTPFAAVIPGELIASQPYVDAAIAAIPPAGGGFPMTRTEVFTATLTSSSQNLMATEAWLEGQLYELVFSSTRHLFMTEGADSENFALNYFLPGPSTATTLVDLVATLRIGTMNVFSARLDNAGPASGIVRINKLT